jgi:hypothetical protein
MLIMYQKYHLACICIHYHAIKFWHKRKGSEELTSDPFSVPGADAINMLIINLLSIKVYVKVYVG